MYNEEQKQRYIANVSSSYSDDYIRNLKSLFNKTAPIENAFGKDVSEFSHEEVFNLYSMVTYGDEFVYANMNSRLSAYCEWCLDQNLVAHGMNHFKEFMGTDFKCFINKNIESKKFLTREQLVSLVNKVVNPRDQFFLLCLFELGKSDHFNDIYLMKLEDIDESAKTVRLFSGRTAKISDLLIEKAKKANEENRYDFPISGRYKPLESSSYIFKRINTGPAKVEDEMRNNKLTAKLVKSLMDMYGGYVGINPSTLAVSGQLDMIRRRSAELGIDAECYVTEHFYELTAQYNMAPNDPKKFVRKYGFYF